MVIAGITIEFIPMDSSLQAIILALAFIYFVLSERFWIFLKNLFKKTE